MSKLPLASALCALSLLAGCYAEPAEEAAALPDAVSAVTSSETEDGEEDDSTSPLATATPQPTPTPTPTPEPAITEEEALSALNTYLESLEGVVSVSCVRISDGYTYEYNADCEYYTASLLKAPYALWLCERADAGEIDLTTALPALDTAPAQTAQDAIYSMISQSDNDAATQLYRVWPAYTESDFSAFLLTLGVDRPLNALSDETNIQGVFSSRDAANILLALWDYFESDAANAASLQQAFLDADHPMLESDYEMAKKYGSWEYALHDMAIVYADEPYCIAVLTSWGSAETDFPEPGASQITEIGNLAAVLMESAPLQAA